MPLPFAAPLKPMLAKLKDDLPAGSEWVYEPKWDGFRAIVWRDEKGIDIISRDGKPLQRYFPELVPMLESALPQVCVVDGEVILVTQDRLEFELLQQRIHPARSRIERLASETPASFVVFDALAEDERDLRNEPFAERRERLETWGLGQERGDVQLTPQTDDRDQAVRWLDELELMGLDGVIAKQTGRPYTPGRRDMVKVKRKRTVDCVIGGYRPSKAGHGVGSLLLGLFADDVLHYVGHTSSFKAAERRQLLALLKPLTGGDSFGRGRTPGEPSRWTGGRDSSWVPVHPTLVCEVMIDKLQGDRFRHAATFLRWRRDKSPSECTFDQLAPS